MAVSVLSGFLYDGCRSVRWQSPECRSAAKTLLQRAKTVLKLSISGMKYPALRINFRRDKITRPRQRPVRALCNGVRSDSSQLPDQPLSERNGNLLQDTQLGFWAKIAAWNSWDTAHSGFCPRAGPRISQTSSRSGIRTQAGDRSTSARANGLAEPYQFEARAIENGGQV